MDQRKKITLAIVTKNRLEKLQRLLFSVASQTVLPLEIIVVDNDVNYSAKIIVNSFLSILPITYIHEQKQGVPFARNTALKNVRTPFMAFVDDDCVLKQDWFFWAESCVNRFPNISYFIGNSHVLNGYNLVAFAQYTHQKYWFLQKLQKKCVTTPFNVDTKNIIFKVNDLKDNNLQFDTSISIGWFDGSDTDMGFAMHNKGLRGIYVKQMQLWHEEPTTLKYFLTKGYYRGKLARLLANKWQIKNEFVFLPYTNWKIYLKSIKGWPREYKEYFPTSKGKHIISFLCLKLYERVFLQGYISID